MFSLLISSLLATTTATRIITRSMSSMSMNRGAFIVFEGGDRSGKTTQLSILQNYFKENNNNNIENMRFPNRTSTIGKMINSYLESATEMDDRTIHLLFSANRWEASSSIENILNSGKTILCDRYAYSGAAFTAAKGYDLNWCMACDKGLPQPDAVIYLNIPVDEAAKRGEYGAERYEKVEFQREVQKKYLELRDNDNDKWHTIDALQTKDDISIQIQKIVNTVINDCKEKPLKKLWTE